MARPMVALARFPGPKRLFRELMPNLWVTGPLTMAKPADPPILEDGPTKLKTGSSMASTAASKTGMYSGKHPAITALDATLATVISRRRSGISPTTSAGGRPAWSKNWFTRSTVGGSGFFWEMWNFYSYPKWIYQIPFVDFLRVFEMPILGYGGYIPFALELFAMYHFVTGLLGVAPATSYIRLLSNKA